MKKTDHIFHALAAFFMPAIPMLYLYARNAHLLSLAHVLIVTTTLGVVSLLGYLIVGKLFRSHCMGLIACLILWIAFFSYGSINMLASERVRYKMAVFFCLAASLMALCYLLIRKRKMRALCLFIDMLVAVLLVWNGFSVLSLPPPPQAEGLHKTEFLVDANLPSPNVYWLHLDGMLSFEAMERYFDDPQPGFVGNLERRGFTINKEAQLGAARLTAIAIPALMCPGFYDDYQAPVLRALRETYQTTLDWKKASMALGVMNLHEARRGNELVNAFQQKGYSTASLSYGYADYVPGLDLLVKRDGDERIILNKENANEIDPQSHLIADQAMELVSLLGQTTMLSPIEVPLRRFVRDFFLGNRIDTMLTIPVAAGFDAAAYIPSNEMRQDEKNLIIGLNEAFSLRPPRLVIGMIRVPHFPFTIDENGHGQKSWDVQYSAHDYAPQHRYAAKYTISVVDFILENDPDAVVVLQSDHGLHGLSAREIMEQFSPTEEAVWDIWNSTMSAVRIPEKYGILAKPLDPLNISRYLVNHFVGENYAYLESEAGEGAL